MLAYDASDISLASAFAIGFTVGVVTTLRLMNVAVTVLRKSIDRGSTDEVQGDEEGNPP